MINPQGDPQTVKTIQADDYSAAVLAKLIDCQDVPINNLPGALLEIAQKIKSCPNKRDVRAKAFTEAIAGLNGAMRPMSESVFRIDPHDPLPEPPEVKKPDESLESGAIDPLDDWPGPDLTEAYPDSDGHYSSAVASNAYNAAESLESENIPARRDDYFPELPESARIDQALGAGVGKWLTDYENFSRLWSPRAYDGFHTACGLWLLSTIAARRVSFHNGKQKYTNLYISLTARTSLYAKSTTAEIALQTLRCINVDWLLAADSATPQKFTSDLTTKLPDKYDDMTSDQKERARLRVGMSGQRGWYYDEFGQHVSSMMRDGGIMADFRGLIRRFDDNPERYEYGTIGRGDEIIERPYLALLANMTPDDLKPFARRGAALWGDGFLARFVLITPPIGERLRDRFPRGERKIPDHILKPLAAWHSRLGLPKVSIESGNLGKGEKPGNQLDITPVQATILDLPEDTVDAFNHYNDALLDILASDSIQNHDLDGNYARLADKALRVAALLASLDDKKSITIEYWARAQGIAETWRAGLHRLYNQINLPGQSQASENEERLLSIIQEKKNPTRRELHQYSKLSYKDIDFILSDLIKAEEIEESINGKAKRYTLKARSVENVDM